MLHKLKKSNNEGFTIIEVMIVLAIAGLIILIVLLAVPALQRNGRNTAIKNDASAVAGGVTEWESNNNGTPPSTIAGTGSVKVGATNVTEAKVQGSTKVYTVTTVPTKDTAPISGEIQVYLAHKCEKGGTYSAGTAGDASNRSVAIYYSTETSSGLTQQCLDS